jgi:hypothetical protein
MRSGWFQANLQLAVDRAVLGAAAAAAGAIASASLSNHQDEAHVLHTPLVGERGPSPGAGRVHGGASSAAAAGAADPAAADDPAASPDPFPLRLSVKPFPWPAVRQDLAAAAAAAFLNLMIV